MLLIASLRLLQVLLNVEGLQSLLRLTHHRQLPRFVLHLPHQRLLLLFVPTVYRFLRRLEVKLFFGRGIRCLLLLLLDELECLQGCESLFWIHFQHIFQQLHDPGTHLPLGQDREIHFSLNIQVDYFGVGLTIEGDVASEHEVENYPGRINIHLGVVFLVLENFGSHEAGSSASSEQLIITFLESCKTKVGYSYFVSSTHPEEHVFRLQISMEDLFGVQVYQPQEDLLQDMDGEGLLRNTVFHQIVQKTSPLVKLIYAIHMVVSLIHCFHEHDVLVAQMSLNFYFLSDALFLNRVHFD